MTPEMKAKIEAVTSDFEARGEKDWTVCLACAARSKGLKFVCAVKDKKLACECGGELRDMTDAEVAECLAAEQKMAEEERITTDLSKMERTQQRVKGRAGSTERPNDAPWWFDDHVAYDPDSGPQLNHVGFGWIMSRPPAVQRLLLKYPPACVLRVKNEDGSLGEWGVNAGIIEGTSDFPTLRMAPEPKVKEGVERLCQDVVVVVYWHGVDEACVQSILDCKPAEKVESKKAPVGRNDPCPCGAVNVHGSAMKWKHCCGRTG